jgi:hypothetical protein
MATTPTIGPVSEEPGIVAQDDPVTQEDSVTQQEPVTQQETATQQERADKKGSFPFSQLPLELQQLIVSQFMLYRPQ